MKVLEQHKNGDIKQQEEIDLHDRTPSMSQGGKQRSPVRNTDVRTVHNSELKIPIEKSSVNVLMGAGRCTFATNGMCNKQNVLSNSVKVSSREWNGYRYRWINRKVTKLIC